MSMRGTQAAVRAGPLFGALVLLAACSQPNFEFRGYTDISDCRNVIDAELALGAAFEDVYDDPESDGADFITELTGTVYDQEVTISIVCNERGSVRRVFYVAQTQEPQETASAYLRFAEELQAEFGVPKETLQEGSRTLSYLCPADAPVLLEEYMLSEDEHELYFAVVPSAIFCALPAGD